MSADAAKSVADVERLAQRYMPAGSTLLAAPVWPGAYALLGVRSPVWEIYPLFPRRDDFQKQEIVRLQLGHPSLILIEDIGVDGRDDLRYARTHPLIWDYLNANYRRVSSPLDPPQLLVYLPKSGVD